MYSARLSSTAFSTRGSHDAVEVTFPGFAGAWSSWPAFWASDRASAGPGLGVRGAVGLAVLCPHGHLISRFQIDSLAGSLAGAAGGVLCAAGGRGSLVLPGNRDGAGKDASALLPRTVLGEDCVVHSPWPGCL